MWVNLKRDGPFGPKKVPGRVRIALTYKSYVDEEEEGADEKEGSSSPYIKVYGDAGAESVEDDGISRGEEIDASLMKEEAKGKLMSEDEEDLVTDDDIETVSIPREDSSVEVTSSPKSTSNGNGRAPATNGNGAANSTRRTVDSDASKRVRQTNGAALRRGDLHPTVETDTVSESESFALNSRGFGNNGDVRVPNGIAGNSLGDSRAGTVWDRELESLTARSSGAHNEGSESSHAFQGWKRSSSQSEAIPPVDDAAFPSRSPDQKDHEDSFSVENEPAEETVSDLSSPKTEGNKLLWLCMFTTVAYIIGCSLHLSNPLHP